VTLTFYLQTSKSIGVFYLISATTLWSLKALAQRLLKLLSTNGFHSLGHCDLNLWPTDHEINKVLLLNQGYPPYDVWRLWVKGYSSYWAETDFCLRVTVTLTFYLLTPKSFRLFNSIRAITLWSLKALAQRVLELLSGNGFHSLGHCDLDLWPTGLKINRGLLLNNATTL